MAFGFSPKHVEEITINNITHTRFYAVAITTAEKLNWNISFLCETGFIAYTKFSMSSWGEEIQVRIMDGKVYLKSECSGSQLFDLGKNKENISDFKSTFNKMKKDFTDAEMDAIYIEIKKGFVPNEEDIFNQTPLSAKEKIKNFFSLFIPTESYFITPILVLLNIIFFIVMVVSGVSIISPDGESLIRWGANFRPVTIDGEWWRFISSCFLHIGIFHLLMNIYALLYIGLMLEPYLGKARFLSAYLLSGIAGSAASFYWHDLTISAGASGAIFGMYGVFLAMLTTNFIEKSARKALITSIAVFVGYNLLNGMKGGIDNAAHIGGLISGLIIGYSYYPSLKNPKQKEFSTIAIGVMSTVILCVSIIILMTTTNSDIAKYDKRMEEFVTLEEKALQIYSMSEYTTNEQYLTEINTVSLINFKNAIELIDEVDKFDLPELVHERNAKMRKYCELRIKSFEILSKAILEGTDEYDEKLEYYNKEIEKIIGQFENPQDL